MVGVVEGDCVGKLAVLIEARACRRLAPSPRLDEQRFGGRGLWTASCPMRTRVLRMRSRRGPQFGNVLQKLLNAGRTMMSTQLACSTGRVER